MTACPLPGWTFSAAALLKTCEGERKLGSVQRYAFNFLPTPLPLAALGLESLDKLRGEPLPTKLSMVQGSCNYYGSGAGGGSKCSAAPAALSVAAAGPPARPCTSLCSSSWGPALAPLWWEWVGPKVHHHVTAEGREATVATSASHCGRIGLSMWSKGCSPEVRQKRRQSTRESNTRAGRAKPYTSFATGGRYQPQSTHSTSNQQKEAA